METGNIMGVGPAAVNYTDRSVSKGSKEQEELAGMFGSMMNGLQQSIPDVSNSEVRVDDVDAINDTQTEYEKSSAYPNRNSDIARSDETEQTKVSETVESSQEELQQFQDDVKEAIAEELGVSTEDVEAMLDTLGLTVFDLLDPQNIGNLMMALTGTEGREQLLLNPQFQNLMGTIAQLGGNLMSDLGLELDEMQELVAQMDVLANPQEVTEDFAGILAGHPGETDSVVETTPEMSADGMSAAEMFVEEIADDNSMISTDGEQDPAVTEEEPEGSEIKQVDISDAGQEKDSEGTMDETGTDSSQSRAEVPQHHNSAFETVTQQVDVNGNFVSTMEAVPEQNSYMSVDTVDLIQQVVEQMRTSISEDVTNIRMQLNPEHLGHVVVDLTSREGTVSAQFTATNEVVKEALEAQLASLRESLNQAGVKVDAIEVTVSAHGFEQNLEQEGHQEEQQASQNASREGRRNINLDSLDELSGMMTEEEQLIAQMMRDNGNTMDVTV